MAAANTSQGGSGAGMFAIPAIGAGLSMLNRILFPAKTGMLDPREYKDDILYSQGDLSRIRQGAHRRISMLSQPQTATMRQFGAANRFPAGAVASGLKGIAYEGGKAVSQMEPQLEQMQHRSQMDYINMLNQYEMAKEQARRYNTDFTGDIGGMTNLAMLWKSGALNPGGGV